MQSNDGAPVILLARKYGHVQVRSALKHATARDHGSVHSRRDSASLDAPHTRAI